MNTPVSFPMAKQLKEKGFNEVCQRWYSVEGGLYYQDEFDNNRGFIPVCECEAPTIAEVVMWMYEKHGIWVQSPFSHNDFKPFCWVITTTKRNLSKEEENRNCWLSGIDTEDIDGWDSPTDAYQAAIEYCLTNLI